MGVSPDIKFEDVAAAALAQAHILLPQWLGGKRVGNEWQGETRANGGLGNSWCVNLTTGHWLHGSGEERGKDLISLYAALNHVEQIVALEQVADLVGFGAAAPVLAPLKPKESPAEPIPLDAPPIPAHFKLGAPSAVYRYGEAFWVARWDTPEGKTFHPYTWRAGKWVAKGYPDPKPIYNAAELAERPDDSVMVVEGEKCADIAKSTLKRYLAVTWAGGAQAVHKAAWQALAGRDVIIWPDADDAGKKAAARLAEILGPIAKRVRVIQPNGQADGWDIADAIASGWDAKAITLWAADHIKTVQAAPVAEKKTRKEKSVVVEGGASAFVSWSSMGLDSNEGGQPHATVANASLIIQMHPDLKGKIWYDSFTDRVMHTLRGAESAWADADDVDMAVFIQQSLRLPKFNVMLVASAVMHAARRAARNSLTDWLDGLTWDQTPRLEDWLSDTLGVARSEYSQSVAVNWPVSMVARAYVPGCKVDTMPVLEGRQGLSKSSFLEILGAPWYGSIPVAFGDKDFLQAIQGHWLVEIPDMTGFSKREHSQILATITIRNDIYRPAYGRYTVEHARTAIFAATSETDDYLQDTRGRRRYWPLRCTSIDLDALHAQREQIFAEAVARYRQGASWWNAGEGADSEQLDRSAPDLWTDKVVDYANECWAESKRTGRQISVTSSRILQDAIEMPLAKQDDGCKRRVARIMRENGWIQTRDVYGRKWKKIERP
jgi:predicted P-loop ATPase